MYDDGPGVFEETFPKARNQHICCECGKIIQKGEEYQYYKGCWDGKWSKFRTCMDCSGLRQRVVESVYNENSVWPPFGDLLEWAEEEGLAKEEEHVL